MAKFKPGIPESFSLNVEPVKDLGDYLDEPSPMPQRRARPQVDEDGEGTTTKVPVPAPVAQVVPRMEQPVPAAPIPEAIVRAPIVQRSPTPAPPPRVVPPSFYEEPPIVLREDRVIPQIPQATPPREEPVNADRLPKPKGPRREISMTPETLRMSDELLELVRSGSGQRDTKANELFHALVLLVHEVMDEIDPHVLPKRGRWGTPTARAYPLELKNAFLRAVVRKYGEEFAMPAQG